MAGISLRDYQTDAVERMKNGCILCGGVGSGKSRTALAYYYKQNGGKLGTKSYIRMPGTPKDLYIITTARKRDTLEWEGELSPFLLSVHAEVNTYKNKVVVDSWNNIGKYATVTDAFFIFDEQRVVGSGAWVKAFLKIAKFNEWIHPRRHMGGLYSCFCCKRLLQEPNCLQGRTHGHDLGEWKVSKSRQIFRSRTTHPAS